jgi:3-hydroxyisobutyrate dehydrogenase-like beta-hydroxyacid dehydrogenase
VTDHRLNKEQESMQDTIGIVGLGNMGTAIAARLRTRFRVLGFDTDSARRELNRANAIELVDSSADLLGRTNTVVLSLPRPSISAATVETLMATGLGVGKLVIETSTVLPADARADAAKCIAAGAGYVDAAILSGVKSVEDGATVLLLGGPEESVERAEPALAAITADRRHLGPVGAGMAAKVINNAVAHDVYVVLAEAVALGRANGIGIDTLVEMLGDPEGGLLRPLTHRIAERLVKRNFDGGMPVDAARKDSQLALDLAQQSNVPLFATQAAHTVYEIAVGAGMGRQDYSAIATLWNSWESA